MRNTQALLAKARRCAVHQVSATSFDVLSPSGETYAVDIQPTGQELHASCTCTWFANAGTACAHILAVELWLAAEEDCHLSFWNTPEEAQRQHRATRQLGDLYITARRPA